MTRSIFFTVCFSSALLLQGCGAQKDDWAIETSPDIRAKLVYVLKKGTDQKQVHDFMRTVIADSVPNGKSPGLLPGIRSVVKVVIGDYEGGEIYFESQATNEQKAFVEKRILESPYVYKIYKDVNPDEITDLERNGEDGNAETSEPSTKRGQGQ